ncbi:SLBB domain-containing protein [Rhodohalobacter sp. 614A]|uniref:SLBB domain-containing protein n=1 Tax=Rhodohalobacter sp. 614A TaxID=2908649 RepID=UPI001F27306C|nr:SLBB domain-containing protein [Rhodohalobacter sp. 614A]
MTKIRAFAFLFFSIVILVLSINVSYAQFGGLDSVDLGTLQSSDISDTQLRAAILRAEQEGITIDQALQMAQARGLSPAVANQLRTRIQQLQMDENFEESGTGDLQQQEDEFSIPQEFIRPERVETEEMRKTFGSQIFRYRETEFSPTLNVATPVNYTLGAGDELVINIWGDQTDTYRLIVNPEGSIFVQGIGPIFVNGLTIEEASDKIIGELERIYSGLGDEGPDQTTYARVSIERLRTIQVSIIGEVTNPGDYTIQSNSTVFNALYRGGGPGEDGSYRTIRVIRDNEVIAEMDLYDFLVEGLQTGNIRLRDRDVIQVPPYKNRVEVKGEVKRSDLYFEVTDGETLEDLLRYAGNFTDRAYTRQIRIHRNTSADRKIVTVNQNEYDDFPVQSGDLVYIDEILNRFENRVVINGAVWRSGEFELKDGMTLHDLIMEAEGLRPDAFMSRGLINRLRDDYTLEQISFDVSEVLQNPDVYDIPLKREDQVLIRSIHAINDEQSVQISGAIRQPGEYNFRDSMTLEDLILKANGFTDAASEARIEISRRILGEALPEQRGQQLAEIYTFDVSRNLQLRDQDRIFQLQPFDEVYIHRRPDYQTQQKVTIEGEVMFPGTYTIQNRDERISDLVKRAGGLTSEAYQQGARLIRRHTAIDRPEIEFDFLDSEEVVNEQQTGLTGRQGQENNQQEENQEKAEDTEILETRTQLNRDDLRSSQNDSLESENGGDSTADSRIGIDLATILENPGSRDDLFLRDGDVLRIPQELQTVAISGAVMQDVEVRYREGANMGYYISRAGGFAVNARKKSVYIVYANGDVDRRKNYIFGLIKSSPPIEPGAHIIIPAKANRVRMNFGEVVSVSAAIVGMTTSLIIALDRLAR